MGVDNPEQAVPLVMSTLTHWVTAQPLETTMINLNDIADAAHVRSTECYNILLRASANALDDATADSTEEELETAYYRNLLVLLSGGSVSSDALAFFAAYGITP